MTIKLDIRELLPPELQFGGAGSNADPKVGLEVAGPFDLRFGAARKSEVRLGLIGPSDMIDAGRRWLSRVSCPIPYTGASNKLYRSFPGFEGVFRASLNYGDAMIAAVGDESLAAALSEQDTRKRFEKVLKLYVQALSRLATRDTNRPDCVLVCISAEVFSQVGTVTRELSASEYKSAQRLAKKQAGMSQLDMFDALDSVEQTEEDFVKRDFRLALKAAAMRLRMPIQLGRENLFVDDRSNQDPATRAWNSSVGLYYKAGGVPWRLPVSGPETCFVGISFHHFRTTQRHVVRSSLAQAFSTEGEGFALRGESVPYEEAQGKNLHLSERQASELGAGVLQEYRSRTGGTPLRMVLHKTSSFNEAEQSGFEYAFRDVPMLEMVTLTPSDFRLLKFGGYPPKYGTVCQVNNARTYLFTSGFMPELGTYPGPHIPQPFELKLVGDGDPVQAARDIINLTRMNWNTADIRGKWPVSMSFARRVGGILDEYGDSDPPPSSFRYFL